MMIKRKLTLDLTSPGSGLVIGGVQNDRYTRALEITLTDAGESWKVPEDAQVLIGYSRPDGSGGQYDTLPNGNRAWSLSGNVLTVILAPQTLAVPGPVRIGITLVQQELQLSTFSVVLNVQAAAGMDGEEEAECSCVSGFLPGITGGSVGQFLRITQVTDTGIVTAMESVDPGGIVLLQEAQELSEDRKSVVRKNLGALSEDMTAVLLPLQELSFAYNEQFGGMVWIGEPAPFELTAGERYRVSWDAEEYECTAMNADQLAAGAVLLGNGTVFGMAGNGEPFIFGYVPGWDQCLCMRISETAEDFCFAEICRVVLPRVLPEVTEEDNGKVLRVVDGTWQTGTEALPAAENCGEGQFLRISGGKWSAVSIENAEGVSF